MSLYYDGNLESDLAELESSVDAPALAQLNSLGEVYGYGRCQQILQILWAAKLKEKGYPTSGALGR